VSVFWKRDNYSDLLGWGMKPGLWRMACWKGTFCEPPKAVIWCSIEPPPADLPSTVTRLGSPPKRWMCFCTHSRASLWSYSPAFAVIPSAPASHP